MDGFFEKETALCDGFVNGWAEPMMIMQPLREVSHTGRLPRAPMSGAYFIGSFNTRETSAPVMLRNRNAKLKQYLPYSTSLENIKNTTSRRKTWQI